MVSVAVDLGLIASLASLAGLEAVPAAVGVKPKDHMDTISLNTMNLFRILHRFGMKLPRICIGSNHHLKNALLHHFKHSKEDRDRDRDRDNGIVVYRHQQLQQHCHTQDSCNGLQMDK